MCRLLLIKDNTGFSIRSHLEVFAQVCRNSKEYQGHGWGLAFLSRGKRETYKSKNPVWTEEVGLFDSFGTTTFLMVHARSAFRDQGISIENNMPFFDSRYTFIFNGELRGVRIKAEGRIGAEKIFNFIKRFDKGNMKEAFEKGIATVQKQTHYIRAMNIMLSDMETVYLCSVFNEDPPYFTMYRKNSGKGFIICSEPYPGEAGWVPIPNNTIEVMI